MPKTVTVKRGQCIDSIAHDERVASDKIWLDGGPNDALIKLRRRDRNVLMPGDKVEVPDRTYEWHSGKETSRTHIFKRTLPKRVFRFDVRLGEFAQTALAPPPTIEIDGKPVPVVQDGQGYRCEIPAGAVRGKITLPLVRGQANNLTALQSIEYPLEFGVLRPLSTPEGQEDRLRNLGYWVQQPDANPPTAFADPTLQQALAHFQVSQGLAVTDGSATPETLDRLHMLNGDAVL